MNYSLFTPTELQILLENYVSRDLKQKKHTQLGHSIFERTFSSDLEFKGIANTVKTAPTVLSLGRKKNGKHE